MTPSGALNRVHRVSCPREVAALSPSGDFQESLDNVPSRQSAMSSYTLHAGPNTTGPCLWRMLSNNEPPGQPPKISSGHTHPPRVASAVPAHPGPLHPPAELVRKGPGNALARTRGPQPYFYDQKKLDGTILEDYH
jgi:hypothetical protein